MNISILATLNTIFRNRFGMNPTTDRAIAGINKAIDQLNAVVAHEEAQIDNHRKAMEDHRQSLVDAVARANRAEIIAERFTAIVKV